MEVFYSHQELPASFERSIFLAGPSPRDAATPSWRPEALSILETLGYDGVVLNPEPGPKYGYPASYDNQIAWETAALAMSDVIACWVPRELTSMPAFTTNVEFGFWVGSSKLLFGAPPGAPKVRYLFETAKRHGLVGYEDLTELLTAAVARTEPGAFRQGAECSIPLHVWHTSSFSSWYASQRAAGNEMRSVELAWNHVSSEVFAWVLHPHMYIASEDRMKTSEIVIGRPDIAAVVAFSRPPGSTDPLDTEVLLVTEYRSPAANREARVHELPGGSAPAAHGNLDPRDVAAEELAEGTGLVVDPSRLTVLPPRQVAATLLSHRAHPFAVALTPEEVDQLRVAEAAGTTFGDAASTEQTSVRLVPFGRIIADDLVDWTNLGMISQALAVSVPH